MEGQDLSAYFSWETSGLTSEPSYFLDQSSSMEVPKISLHLGMVRNIFSSVEELYSIYNVSVLPSSLFHRNGVITLARSSVIQVLQNWLILGSNTYLPAHYRSALQDSEFETYLATTMLPELRSIPLNCAKGFRMLGPLFESMITASFNTPSTVETELFALKPSDRSVNDFLTSDTCAAFQPMDHPNNHFVLILVNSIHGLPIHPLLPSYITPSLRYCSPRHRKQVNPYSLPPRPSPDATSESLLPYSQTSPPRFPSPVLSAPSTLHAGPDNIGIDNLSDGALPVTDRRSANDRDLVPDGTSADVAAACHQLGFVLESVKYQRRQGRGVSFLNMLNNLTATSNFIVALGYDRNGGLESQKVTFKDGPQSFADLLVNELGWEIRGYQKKRTLFQWAEEATLRRKWSLVKSQNTEAFRTWMRMCYIWHDPGFVRTHSRLDSNADDEKELS
ncbi:hypothetical protein EV368DRAFT_89941 [Lentinula lateritia]|nr:hypothetical protein EV368DRAFT_89941 [Lentinula lateritia]